MLKQSESSCVIGNKQLNIEHSLKHYASEALTTPNPVTVYIENPGISTLEHPQQTLDAAPSAPWFCRFWHSSLPHNHCLSWQIMTNPEDFVWLVSFSPSSHILRRNEGEMPAPWPLQQKISLNLSLVFHLIALWAPQTSGVFFFVQGTNHKESRDTSDAVQGKVRRSIEAQDRHRISNQTKERFDSPGSAKFHGKLRVTWPMKLWDNP